jgi:hypothetical protein
MLVHFFWLLEFKFKFEFHCLNPFQTQNQIPKPSTPTHPTYPILFGPATQPASAAGRAAL